MIDLRIIDINNPYVQPIVQGKTTDNNLILYQKVLIVLLTDNRTLFRQNAGTQLISLLGRTNYNSSFLQSRLEIIKQQVLDSLDQIDRQAIAELTLTMVSSQLDVTIQFTDGTIIQEVIK